MDTTDTSTTVQFAAAGALLEALAARDFEKLADALDRDASLSALLPRGYCEWHGAPEVRSAFERFFGDAEEFEVVDAAVGQVGSRLQLRWRVRVRAARFGAETMIAEQHVYADTTPGGRIREMSLLCSGFCKEHVDG